MLRKRNIIVVTLAILVMAAVWTSAAGVLVDQKSVLSGTVQQCLVAPGTNVREGDVLVVVDSITGPVPAVRATVDGIVREVLVLPGNMIQTGDIVVKIEASK